MSISRGGRIGGFVVASAMALATIPGPAAAAASVIYNSMPSTVPGNVASLGYEATSTFEFGDAVTFAPSTPRLLTSATVLMSSWGCESGNWFNADCVTTPGATFSHDLTIKFYNPSDLTNALGSKTQTFAIPYRPSSDSTNCTGGRWYQVSTSTCFNGYATPVTFNLSGMGIGVPDTAVVTISYNTTHYGAAPMGEGAGCYTESGGCGYDSLNVGLIDFTSDPVSVGSNPAPDDAYYNSTYAPNYCDGGTGGTGTLRLDAGCWTGFKPAISISAEPVLGPPSFTGFFTPVYNMPTLNVVQAGSTVPIKFSLGGDYGLDIFQATYPSSVQINCPTSHPTKNVKTTTTGGATSTLSFNATNNQYNYNWKTQKTWKGTCREITFYFTGDSSPHVLDFKFTK